VLDIVAPDQDQATTAVHGGRIDHGQPRLAAARGRGSQPLAAEAAHDPQNRTDQSQENEHADEVPEHLRAEQTLQHCSSLRPPGLDAPTMDLARRSGIARMVNAGGNICSVQS
jgi:hypothetical protein